MTLDIARMSSPAELGGALKNSVNTGGQYDIAAMGKDDLQTIFSKAQDHKEVAEAIAGILSNDLLNDDFEDILDKAQDNEVIKQGIAYVLTILEQDKDTYFEGSEALLKILLIKAKDDKVIEQGVANVLKIQDEASKYGDTPLHHMPASKVDIITKFAEESELVANAIAEVLPVRGSGGNTPVHNMDAESVEYVKRLADKNPAVEKGLIKGISTYSTSSGQRPIDDLDSEDLKRKLLEDAVLSAAKKSDEKVEDKLGEYNAGVRKAEELSFQVKGVQKELDDLTAKKRNQLGDNKITFNAMLIALTKDAEK